MLPLASEFPSLMAAHRLSSQHEVLACVAQGIVVILTNHSNSERGYLRAVLLDKLQGAIAALGKQYQVCVSERDRDPLETM